MLSRTFNLPPVGIINKHKHELVNPKIIVPVKCDGNEGYTITLSITIPEGYSFLDDLATYDDFQRSVSIARKKLRVHEQVFEVSQLQPKDAKIYGGRAGVNVGGGWSNGQIVTASFLSEKDVSVLKTMVNLIPENPERPVMRALSHLASALKRSAFLTDDDGEYMYFKEYYRDGLPMFILNSVGLGNKFKFNHLKLIM